MKNSFFIGIGKERKGETFIKEGKGNFYNMRNFIEKITIA